MNPPYDTKRDPRHEDYRPMGTLDRKISGTLPAVTIDAGKRLVHSWRPTVSEDGKLRVSLVTALLLASLLAGAVGWAGYRMGWAEGYIEASALFRPTAAH